MECGQKGHLRCNKHNKTNSHIGINQCCNCASTGHVKENCKEPKFENWMVVAGISKNLCYYCLYPDHFARDCPLKKMNKRKMINRKN